MARDTHSKIINLTGGDRQEVELNEFPDNCAWCDRDMTPDFILAHSLGRAWDYDEVVEAVFQCSNNDCKRYFIAYYGKVERMGRLFFLRARRAPHYWKTEEFSELIEKISTEFVIIYNQAKIAEDLGLDRICGTGYGKSLEYLIKDYLIKQNPKEKDEIKKMCLGDCIKRIEDSRIRTCSERAQWLRHDETHYQRKWEDKDISHLKELIHLVTNWIENVEITRKYETEMPEKHPSK